MQVGAGFLIALIEGANEMLSNKYNIVLHLKKKLFFVNLAFLLFLK